MRYHVKNDNDQKKFPHCCGISSLMTRVKEEKEDKSYHMCILS
jgi:hypothetical protein